MHHDSHRFGRAERNPRTMVGVVLAFLGAIAFTIGVSASPAAGVTDTQNLPLNNTQAPNGTDCPDSINDYWHFVITPNNGTFSFVTITLDLAGTVTSFTGAQIIPNGSQTDNVFVQVPAGATFTSIVKATSHADVTPSTGQASFVLSHLCDGAGTTTTTTTSTTTTSTTTTSTTSTTSTTTTTTTLPCEWNPQLPPGDPDCVEPTTTTSTTTTTTTTLPCEWNPQLPPGDPDCVEPTTTSWRTSSWTSYLRCEWNPQLPPGDPDCVEPTTTTSTTTTTTTTLPCEWNPQLPPGSPDCVPETSIQAICYDIDNSGATVQYWHRLTNSENVPVAVTWADGSATIAANSSTLVSSANAIITIRVDGKVAATTPAPSTEFCQIDVTVEKQVDGPGEPDRTYTIQISRLVGSTYLQEGDTFELASGESITIPLPSTFNPLGVNYKIEEIDAGGASATSITPDSFFLNGHKGETISVVVRNDFAAISLEKTVDATTIQPGQELNYTLIAENTGALDLDPIVIFDRLPPEVVFQAASIVGNAGTCSVIQATRPQLVRCDLDGVYAPGDFTPAITLLVQVDPNLTSSNPILNQAQSIGVYDGSDVGEQASTDLSCEPTEGQVCDLSAKIGVGAQIPPSTTVENAPPTTVGTGSNSPTTVLGQLPKTGSDSTHTLVVLGALLMLMGGVLLVGTRREYEVA